MSSSLKDILNGVDDKYSPEMKKAIDHLPMTAGEIVSNYRQSEKKAADIQRLADLCGCPRDLIVSILTTELGDDQLPKKRGRKKKEPETVHPEKTVPAKAPEGKVKETVSYFVMEAVQDKMDQVNSQLQELTREIFVMEQRKEEMENAYRSFVDFMESHIVENDDKQGV